MDYSPGDVFQINERDGRDGWIGAFVLATEIESWGIQGFVHQITSHDEHACAFIRLAWDKIDYIGHAVLVPAKPNDMKGEPDGQQPPTDG